MSKFFSILLVCIFLSACAYKKSSPPRENDAVSQILRSIGTSTPTPLEPTQNVNATNSNGKNGSATGPVVTIHEEVFGKKLQVSTFDYPVVINPQVEKWITYFTGKGKPFFEKYLERGRYFIPEIARILKTHGMPQDLVYLAMIESGFNNSAKSRARAVGPWQFIRQTGARYGLKIDYWMDERRDTRKATLAAIAYLKELYAEFGSWELSAAGYNAGENKVRRAIKRYKTFNFWELAKHRFFKRETRDYVPKIMAAAILTKNPELFGFQDPFNKGLKPVVNPTAFLAQEDTEEELTPKELGEELSKNEDTADDPEKDESTNLLVEEEGPAAEYDDNHAVVSQNVHPTITPSVYMVANPHEQILEFELKGPVDLFTVAKASGLPYSTMKLLNPELLRWCTPPYYKTYKIKLPQSVKDRFLATYNDDSFDRRVVFTAYKVRPGDSVSKVASRFRVEASPIREINDMSSSQNMLRVGSSIFLPVPTGYKRVIASIYDDKPSPPRKRYRYKKRPRYRTHSVRAKQFQTVLS